MIQFPDPKVEQFFQTYVITDFAVSNDEKKLIFCSNLNGKMNLWAMDLPDTFPYLFAHKNESTNFIKFDRENRYVLAGFDKNGDENYQIYAIPPNGGFPQPLITGKSDEKYIFGHLSKDGERIYYMTSKDNPNFINTRVRNLADGTDTLLLEGEIAPTFLAAVNEKEDAFVYMRMFANTYALCFVNVDGETHYLTPNDQIVHVTMDPIFTDDKTVYFITDYESEFNYLAKFDLETKQFVKVLAIENESVQSIHYNKKRNVLYLKTEKGVEDFLYRFDLQTEQLTNIKTPVHVIDKIAVAESGNIYLLGLSSTVPKNIYKTEDEQNWKPLTGNRVLGVREEEMVQPEIVTYPSFDGMEIEALLFKAKKENDNGHFIFWPHGGPQAAERKAFRSMFQYMLMAGYSIFAPNFRGSTGYGSTFTKLVEQDWGEGPRLDCVYGIEWLFENNIVDRDKLFLMGGSFGGYMALLLHGRHPEYFKAVVDIFGPSDLFTFVNSVPEHWKPIMERWVGDPVRDKERFIKDSPVTYLDSMTKPMLVIQGANDPRVVKEESDQIVAKLREKGREVEYLVLEDEGHGFAKKENEMKVYKLIGEFFAKHHS